MKSSDFPSSPFLHLAAMTSADGGPPHGGAVFPSGFVCAGRSQGILFPPGMERTAAKSSGEKPPPMMTARTGIGRFERHAIASAVLGEWWAISNSGLTASDTAATWPVNFPQRSSGTALMVDVVVANDLWNVVGRLRRCDM